MEIFPLQLHGQLLKLTYILLLSIGCDFIHVLEAKMLFSKKFNVLSYGAIGNGHTDDTDAFQKAWKQVCEAQDGLLEVPSGYTFLIYPITFEGSCNGQTSIEVNGVIKAPQSIDAWKDHENLKWIQFEEMSNLIVFGKGTFNGQGQDWWACKKNKDCKKAPTAVAFSKCENCTISGVKFVDSQQKHFVFSKSKNGLVDSITIKAPPDSPNTDGIHLNECINITIQNSNVKTGDDCISIGKKNSNIKINNMYCGEGCHGISVGSLGKDGGEVEQVSHVDVSNSILEETTNGLRIKTWPGGQGYAKDFTYSNITMVNVKNPIIINQDYCPKVQGICKESLTGVQISNVLFTNIHGTSTTSEAVTLDCSENVPCIGITMNNVQLTLVDSEEPTTMTCINAHGTATLVQPTSCLI